MQILSHRNHGEKKENNAGGRKKKKRRLRNSPHPSALPVSFTLFAVRRRILFCCELLPYSVAHSRVRKSIEGYMSSLEGSNVLPVELVAGGAVQEPLQAVIVFLFNRILFFIPFKECYPFEWLRLLFPIPVSSVAAFDGVNCIISALAIGKLIYVKVWLTQYVCTGE